MLQTSYKKTSIRVILIAIVLSGCSSLKSPANKAAEQDASIFSSPLRAPKPINKNLNTTTIGQQSSQTDKFEVIETPSLSTKQAAALAKEDILPTLKNIEVSRLAFNNMPVPSFINEVFGNQLDLNYIIKPSIQDSTDLVTMRLAKTVSQKDLYLLAAQTLKSYGVSTSIKDDVLIFNFSEDSNQGEIPLLISGRALPEVPSNSRPIFYIYPLTSVSPIWMRGWLLKMFPHKELDISDDPIRNILSLKGPQNIVKQAIEAAKSFDKPSMQGLLSSIIRPNLSSVKALSTHLEQILKSEGYNVSQSRAAPIRLLPLESIGQLVVFARTPEILDHVIQWATTLETKRHSSIEQGLFSYQVQSTQALHIVEVLNSLGVADFKSTSKTTDKNGSQTSKINNNTVVNSNKSGRYAVDEQLNTILFSGSGKDWLQVIPIIKKLDKPAPSVMVEVILTEVKLTDEEKTGFEWLGNASLGKFGLDLKTIGGLGLGGAGLTSTLLSTQVDTAGQTRAILNAFYKDDKATIRSRPRIMVKSGGEASIDVGNEIPVITSSSQGTTDANAPVIQTISYRKTGVTLEIKPTVHASGFVDIEITQELSEAAGSASAATLSPTILNRRISTTVTLRDGGSVLLGGLISSTNSEAKQGIPILGRLPFIGKLFSSDTENIDRTELMIMIIPYILNSPQEAEKLTDELQKSRIDDLSGNIADK